MLRQFGCVIGHNVLIRPSVRVTYPWKVSLGDNVWIGDNAELYSLGEIRIGSDVVISQRSYVCGASHDYTKPTFDMVAKRVVIEDQVWIASDVFVAPGVRVGRGAVIGARSSVFSDVAPGRVYLGTPARDVGQR